MEKDIGRQQRRDEKIGKKGEVWINLEEIDHNHREVHQIFGDSTESIYSSILGKMFSWFSFSSYLYKRKGTTI